MLVLSRHRNEAIIIGDNVRIVVVDVRGDKVRIGIDAPEEVAVHRQEVFDAIKRASQVIGCELRVAGCENPPPDNEGLGKPTRAITILREAIAEVEKLLILELHNNRDPMAVPGLKRAIELVQTQRREFEPIKQAAGVVVPVEVKGTINA